MLGERECQFEPPPPPNGFSTSKERVKPWIFATFNIIISHIFPDNFIEIHSEKSLRRYEDFFCQY